MSPLLKPALWSMAIAASMALGPATAAASAPRASSFLAALDEPIATTFDLGQLSESVQIDVSKTGLTGTFAHNHTFSLAAGAAGMVTALFHVPQSPSFSISTLDGVLWENFGQPDASVAMGGLTDNNSLPGLPARLVVFATWFMQPDTLYSFTTFGTVCPCGDEVGAVGNYAGTITFTSVAGPVPEPGALGLMALGVAAAGAMVRRRR